MATTIALISCPNMLATSLTFPKEMLQAAQQIAAVKHRRSEKLQFINLTLSSEASDNLAEISVSNNTSLCQWQQTTESTILDLVIVPAIWRSPAKAIKAIKPFQALFTNLAANGTRFAATGTGTWLLAELGLLNGHAATTHWYFLSRFAQRYPKLDVKTQHLITKAGQFYCASSINSLADLTILLIEEIYGLTIANHVQQQFSPEARQGLKQHIFIEGKNNAHNDELIAEAQQWLRQHYQHAITLNSLASYLNISPRTLSRRFNHATGISPIEYLLQYRLQEAKELLRQTNLSIADIAEASGFNSSAYFSRIFNQQEGCTPSIFRQSVKSKLFSDS